MLKEIEDVVIHLRRRHHTSRIVIGSDLNVSLASSLEGLTGSRIHSNANGAPSRWRGEIRRELNAKLRMDKGDQVNRLVAGYFDRGKQTLEMQLPDGPSSDRHAWAAAAGDYGREVYRDDNNNVWHNVRLRQVRNRRL